MNAKIYILVSANNDDKEITCGLFDTLADAQAMMKKDFNAWLDCYYDDMEITKDEEKQAGTEGSVIFGMSAYLHLDYKDSCASMDRETPYKDVWWEIKEREIGISVGTHTYKKGAKP